MHRKQMKYPEGLIRDLLLNNIHSSVIVVTPRELAGHLVLLEIRLSADQCNVCVLQKSIIKKTNVNQTRKKKNPPHLLKK